MGMLPFIVYTAAAGTIGLANSLARPDTASAPMTAANHLRLTFENDSPSGRDRNYTHGTRIDYARSISQDYAWGISLTQNMYTPETDAPGRVEGEHPYCGYMALGGAFMGLGRNFGWATELQVGTTGNASCAGRFQNVLHDMMKIETWHGWHDQIPSEVTVQFSGRQMWRIPQAEFKLGGDWSTDASFSLLESVGTFRIAGGAGVSLRIGRNLPPAMDANGNLPTAFGISLLQKPDYNPRKISYFLALDGYMEYVARDLTIDGGVFHDFSRSCTRVPWQARANAGLGLAYAGVDYFMGLSVSTRTYKTQDENSVMGIFTVTLHW